MEMVNYQGLNITKRDEREGNIYSLISDKPADTAVIQSAHLQVNTKKWMLALLIGIVTCILLSAVALVVSLVSFSHIADGNYVTIMLNLRVVQLSCNSSMFKAA